MAIETLQLELDPLPYHVEVRDYLKVNERAIWDWFASAQAQADYTENLRLELLKATYRLDAEGHADLYKCVDEAKGKLNLDIPVTVYQAQSSPHTNATLYYIPGEGHIVFSGPALSLLNPEELKSVIGHELAHYYLWGRDGGEFLIADRLLDAIANDPRSARSHEQTARRFQLYTEIFADRGSLCVTEDVHPVVAGLVKMQTGLAQVSASSYLKQAEEIFSKRAVSTEGISHPESFIRVRSLALWANKSEKAAERVAKMIEGASALDELDLIGQIRLAATTRRFLEHFLSPKWFQTPVVIGHARLFFDNFRPAAPTDTSAYSELDLSDTKLREYVSYLLLDFALIDRELDEMPLAAALEFSRKLEIDAEFEKLAARELKMKVRDVRKLKEQAAELLTKTEAQNA
jgi:hypothetical protein